MPDDIEIWHRHLESHNAPALKGEIRFRIHRPDGEVRWIRHVYTPVFSDKGDFLGSRASNRDITKEPQNEKELVFSRISLRHQVEERTKELLQLNQLLLKREKHYRMLFEGSRDAIFIVDADTGIIVEVNQQAASLLGVERDKIVGMHQSQLYPPDKRGFYESVFRELANNPSSPSFQGEVINAK